MSVIEQRKNQHIDLCAERDVEDKERVTGFDTVSFMPCTLPEIDWQQLDTSVNVWGRVFDVPLLISGMTFGVDKSELINLRLAKVAARFNIPMGIGSQRIALQKGKQYDLKKNAAKIFLIANLGVSQLSRDNCQRAIEMVNADAIAIHLNVMQELIQNEGDRNFNKGIYKKIAEVCHALPCPVIVKEVGFGIDPTTAQRLFDCGVRTIDVGGKGGTAWGWIEGLRADNPQTMTLAESFRSWGIPTAFATRLVRKQLTEEVTLIATGGIRDGLTVAKALALGANLCGIGLPLLRAALIDEQHLEQTLSTIIRGLKVTMLATASCKTNELQHALRLGLPGKEEFFSGWSIPPDKKLF